jgi:hypothetical protein
MCNFLELGVFYLLVCSYGTCNNRYCKRKRVEEGTKVLVQQISKEKA